MKKITDILKEKKFTLSVEIVPPRNNMEKKEIIQTIKNLKGKVDFISVTKGAGGSLRGGTLPISYLSQRDIGIISLSHFVCREHTRQEIENELVDMEYLGIHNILALRGDKPAGSNEEWNGDYPYAYKLVEQINNMNKGIYLPRTHLNEAKVDGEKTDFCIIVAGHPEDKIEDEIKHMKSKINAGADAIITQMVFSFNEFKEYFDNLKKHGITTPIIAGVRPLTTIKQAESVENFFGLKVCDELKNGLLKDGENFGLDYAANMIKQIKAHGASGVHLFSLNDTKTVDEIIKRIK